MSSKGLRLRFKGDEVGAAGRWRGTRTMLLTAARSASLQTGKTKKKKSGSSKRRREEAELADKQRQDGPPDGNEQAWVPVERLTDLAGPSFLFQAVERDDGKDDGRWYCLGLNPALHRVEAHALQPPPPSTTDRVAAAEALALDLDGAEVVQDGTTDATAALTPTDVTQVWVATRVLDTPSSAPRYTLRSSESRFITSEPSGGVSATAEARGPLEEWTLVEGAAGCFCLASANATLLGLDETAGGKMVVRSEAEAPASPAELWQIRVQWKFRAQARKKEDDEKPVREREAALKRART